MPKIAAYKKCTRNIPVCKYYRAGAPSGFNGRSGPATWQMCRFNKPPQRISGLNGCPWDKAKKTKEG